MTRPWLAILTLCLSAAMTQAALADRPHFLVDNCSNVLSDAGGLKFSNSTAPKVGLGALKINYGFAVESKLAEAPIPDNTRSIPTAGKLVFWVKGDGSANELQFVMTTAQIRVETDGRRTPVNPKAVELPRVKIAESNWKEVTLDLATLVPPDNIAWLSRVRVVGIAPADKAATQPTRYEGSVEIDDIRLYPAGGTQPATALATALLGPTVRDFTNDFSLSLDARNFTTNKTQIKVRLTMTDRNQNAVADRDFTLDLDANGAKEFKLDMAPENIGLYLPPFRIAGDVMSAEIPTLTSRIDTTVVMGNSKILVDNFSDVYGRWHTRGYPLSPGRGIGGNPNEWNTWMMGEASRAVPWTQISAKISRVTLEKPADVDVANFPPDRYAMKVDYISDAAIFNGAERFLPGNAYKFGVWVKGDGSNTVLSALFFDYTDLADFYAGGWKRTQSGMRTICRLNYTGWKFWDVALPGNGLGANTLRGSTESLDFPLELSAFVIQPASPPPPPPAPAAGAPPAPAPPPYVPGTSVLIGPAYAYTQQTAATTLAAMIGYDDPGLDYDPKHGATVSVQNAWRVGSRKVDAIWTLSNKDNQPILSGKQELDIPAEQTRSFRIELAGESAKIMAQAAPYRLQVVASDKQDAATSVTREVDLARPDSVVALADFETDRGYLGTKAEGIMNAPVVGEPIAFTSAEDKHSGQRALKIVWEKDKENAKDNEKKSTRFVAIDPPIPGVSVDVTMWVKGDGSGALFYPLVGGPKGVRHGLGTRNWNLFLPRVIDGEFQDAVKLDFTDWRKFTFHFPPVPPDFDKPLPVLHFIPTYPQGLHLAVDARGAKGDGGAVFVDDVTVRTHLPPANRLGFSLRRDSESNIVRPDAKITFRAANFDAAAPRKATVTGGVFDWRGTRVAAIDTPVELKPGEVKDIVLAQQLPQGAYELRAQLKDGDAIVGSVTQDLLIADLAPILGPDWQAALKDEWKLRLPIKDDFTYLDEDWDWVEYYPGNIQTETMRNRFSVTKKNGAQPWMLLGFSALWSSGTGFEQFKMGAFNRVNRHVGQGVDIFLVPARDVDWENYVMEVIRSVGNDVAGWVLWDNPDGTSSLALTPARLASFIRLADKWRVAYCPKTPLIIGGMARATAVPYLVELGKHDALSHIGGVNVRMDVGRMSPEDSQVLGYAKLVREVLAQGGPEAKLLLLTELDWAVEKTADGLNVFDQAAYLTRSDLLLSRAGVAPTQSIRNGDFERLGTGLAYRTELQIPPMREQTLTFNLKPAWWAMVRTRDLLSKMKSLDLVPVQDVIPERTQAMLFERTADGRAVAIVWRNDDAGFVTFSHTGLAVESAQDIFGATTAAVDGWYGVGKMPVVFTLTTPAAAAREGLSRLWVRDAAAPAWPQSVVASFTPDTGKSFAFAHTGGAAATLTGKSPTGVIERSQGLVFASGGNESFTLDAPAGAGIVLRKKYVLDKTGQSATVTVNGKPAGTWNLKRTEATLSEGVREAVFVIDASLLAGQPKAQIQITYEGPANTLAWTALEYKGGDFPLSAIGPVHADQQVGPIRIGRNMAGGVLKVDVDTFANGIGAYANCLLEYPLNGQFKRFAAKVGVDSATEGRGSVVFEVWADGKKVWTSGIMSGLDRAKAIDIDVTGVNRLRLILSDGGDGNKLDAGDWCEPVLKR